MSSAEYFQESKSKEMLETIFSTSSGEITLIIHDWHKLSGIVIPDSTLLPKMLDGFYGFEWYATNRDLSFLVAQSDSDSIVFAKRQSPESHNSK